MKFIRILFFSFLIILIYAILIEPLWIKVNKIDYQLSGTLKQYSGLKIVHISDLHLTKIGIREKITASKIKKLSPNIIFITGDLTDRKTNIPDIRKFIQMLGDKGKVFLVFGNSDYTHAEEYLRTLKVSLGDYLIRNEYTYATFKNRYPIIIAGIDDPVTGHADYKTSIPYRNDIFRILLIHAYTKEAENLAKESNLILAGHTHGGQINILPEKIFKELFKKIDGIDIPYIRGYKKIDKNSYLNINNGIGTSIIRARLFARPEITLIRLI